MWTFAPALVFSDSRIVSLPRPIVQLRATDAFDSTSLTVPFRDGSVRRGRSRGGVNIAIRGQLARTGDTLALSEPEMHAAIESVRAALRIGNPEETFGLALYRYLPGETSVDDARVLRGFMGCTSVKFEYDLSDRALYGYSLIVHASEPSLRDGPLIDVEAFA